MVNKTKSKAAPKKAPKAKPKTATKTASKVAAKPAAKAAPKPKAKPKPASTPKAKAPASSAVKAAAAPKVSANKAPAKKPTVAKPIAKVLVEKKRSRESAMSGPFQVEPYKEKKGERYMNNEQLQHFRQLLATWDNELREGVDRTVHHMKDEAAIFPDPLDRAAQEEEFTLELRTRDRERKLIKKIEESLELIETGEYGFCESCGAEIGIRRLEARPTATLCIDCKTIDEIREKQEIG
jgi:DnaK suppressor protein